MKNNDTDEQEDSGLAFSFLSSLFLSFVLCSFPFTPLSFPPPFLIKCFSVWAGLLSKSVSPPLRKRERGGEKKLGRRETKRERGGGQEREEDAGRWKMMALRISILRWDTFSIIEFSLRSPPLCLSLREPRCHFVFSQGWVKLGANPSCSAQGTHKQHNVTSYSLPSTWKFRGRCLQPSESRGCLLSNSGLSVFQKNKNHCGLRRSR